jgi:hypothetical protein
MGGITFEALILGRRVISHLDFDDFFGRRPPILQCSSIEEIGEAVRVVISVFGRMMGPNKWVPSAGYAGRNEGHGVILRNVRRREQRVLLLVSGELGID